MSLFLPETWPFSIDLLPEDAYLVGGSVRDRLLNRQASYLDLDFVLPKQAVETAAAIARHCGAGFVVLDEARRIARVVFEAVTVDFAQQQGDSLEADLRRRDFTINAIAYNPHRQTLIDPLGGEADIAARILRMVSAQNLADDPLRLLRGYRQAAQLGFTLDPMTQVAIGELAPRLQSVSMERVRSELDALLSVTSRSEPLKLMLKSQLLQFCLPHLSAPRIDQVAAIDSALKQFEVTMPSYADSLHGWGKPVPAGLYRSWIKAAKLSRLLGADVSAAAARLSTLKYSRHESQVVLTLIKVHAELEKLCQGPLSRAQQFFLFKAAGDAFPAVSLLALSQGADLGVVRPIIEKFLDSQNPVAHAQPLMTGTILMKQLGIKPGPEVGKWLKAVEQAQANGDVRSAEAAIAWVEQQKDDDKKQRG